MSLLLQGYFWQTIAWSTVGCKPALSGDVKTLNIPSYQNSQCTGICSFTRTFRSVANVAATYTATADACTSSGLAVIIEPTTFTIPAGVK
jgi:hypothetical protein